MTDEFDPAEQRRKELAERFAREAAEQKAEDNAPFPEPIDDLEPGLPDDSDSDVRS